VSDIAVFERCVEAISNRDAETLTSLSADDVEIRPLRAALEDTVYRGHAGIEQWMGDIAETWAELRIDVESVEEPTAGSVIAFVTLHGRGHESSVPTSMPVALTARLRDGLVVQAATWTDPAAALRDASSPTPTSRP
jgi:ketosteroid isomerase-like protein